MLDGGEQGPALYHRHVQLAGRGGGELPTVLNLLDREPGPATLGVPAAQGTYQRSRPVAHTTLAL